MAGPSVYGLLPIAGAPSAIASYNLIHANSSTNRIECIDDNGDTVPFLGDGPFDTVNYVNSASNRTLDADDLKSLQIYNNTGTSTWTLPAANAFPEGGLVGIQAIGNGILTVERAGTDTIDVNQTSIDIDADEGYLFVSNGTDGWYALAFVGSSSGSTVSMPDQPESGDYTLQASDAGQTVAFTGSSEATFTLPAASTFSDGDLINIVNSGTANLAIAPPSGTSLAGYENDIQPVLKPGEGCQIMSNGSAYRWLSALPKRFAITLAMIQALTGSSDEVDVRTFQNGAHASSYGASNGTAAAGTTQLQGSLGTSAPYSDLIPGQDLQSTFNEAFTRNAAISSGTTVRARFQTFGGGNLSAVTTMTRVEFELAGAI